jgi:Prolipoprotein diacylglyceryl transferase
MRVLLNRTLDALVWPEVIVLHRSLSAFMVCGYSGLACALALAMALGAYLDLSLWVMAVLVLSSVLTVFALALAMKILTGAEQLIYYHHEIAVLSVVTVELWLLHQPRLPYLDAIALAVGAFMSCGRIGCLMVGCCHGRPCGWGVCYRAEHRTFGFPPYYVGVRLFPIQVVESLWALFLTVVGSLIVVNGLPSGSAFAWYLVAYDGGRFCCEFLRGDPERPYYKGFSEAQWIAVSLTALVALAELFGLLPLQWWHVDLAVCLVLTMLIVAGVRRCWRIPKDKLLHPHHIQELAEVVEAVSCFVDADRAPNPTDVPIGCTSFDVLVSASRISNAEGSVYTYTLSYRNKVMEEEAAQILAELICQLRHCSGSGKLIRGRAAVFHVLTPSLHSAGDISSDTKPDGVSTSSRYLPAWSLPIN